MASPLHGQQPHGTRPSAPRPRPGRLRRALVALLVAGSVAVPLSGAARPGAVQAPAPAVLPPLSLAGLDARFEENRTAVVAAERMARDNGNRRRARVLGAMAEPGRHFLSFDGRDGGRTAEVVGDLAHADRIAVLVPGSDTSLDLYGRLRDDALALAGQLGPHGAVIAWMGYETPSTTSPEILTAGRAEQAAPQLSGFTRELRSAIPAARVSLLCHSYGSVVCAKAASDVSVTAVVLYASPGTGYDTAASLHTHAVVWAGRARADWIADVPHIRIRLPWGTLGFGTDPVSRQFGARLFDAGAGGHSDYLAPGSVSLKNIAEIVDGRSPREVRHA
ncbi:alpha/beta hydrolase [Streptomyces sp. NPDC006632]|uniref:alpha/beta hydrolase n=1 Tax=Streptomyces sp. NPDC006632 TaxID=3157182 RepID=UPI0033A787AA